MIRRYDCKNTKSSNILDELNVNKMIKINWNHHSSCYAYALVKFYYCTFMRKIVIDIRSTKGYSQFSK